MNAFTRCPNGDPGNGSAHDFCDYAPGEREPDQRPLIFCERCGEVRALALPPMEAMPLNLDLRVRSTVTAAPPYVTHEVPEET